MKISDGFTKTRLPNGLTVLIKEAHAAPVASFWLWYRVGSRNERLGTTGISHWVEHMLFKGTASFPRGIAEKAIAREGGVFNGMTWYDFTTFYATLPEQSIDLALRIEADRMENALFDEKEVASERTVIISERQGAENDPEFLLDEETMSAAFRVHPYGNDTVGHMCDLETITRAQLYDHYRTYYTPANALAVAAGDFPCQQMLDSIAEHFGGVAAGSSLPAVTAVEPRQRGERRIVLEGEGDIAYFQIAFHSPPVEDKDFFALTVVDAILTGASGLSIFGGGTTNKSSRLYRRVVSGKLASGISGTLVPTIDPFVYKISAVAQPGVDIAALEDAVATEIAQIVRQPVTQEELDKAIKQTRAQFAYSSESVTGQALWMGFSEIFADYGWFGSYLTNLSAVTAEDVQSVASRYLQDANRTVGWYVPSSVS